MKQFRYSVKCMEEAYGYLEKLTNYRIEILIMIIESLLWKICLFFPIPNIRPTDVHEIPGIESIPSELLYIE